MVTVQQDRLKRLACNNARKTLKRAKLRWKIAAFVGNENLTFEDYVRDKARISGLAGRYFWTVQVVNDVCEATARELEHLLAQEFQLHATVSTLWAFTPMCFTVTGWSAELTPSPQPAQHTQRLQDTTH